MRVFAHIITTGCNQGDVAVSATAKNKDKTILDNSNQLIDAIDQLGRDIAAARDGIGRIIYGQSRVVEETLITLLAGGHLLLIGVPGLGKTLLVETLGTVFDLDDRRVQFTPDLMPADILGSEVLEESERGRRTFRFIKGPVFCQLLMADEINRASPRTQSALLQAMQEHRVSVAGKYYDLPEPFHVLATQNPLELEGTYPLPEAQLDRFFMQVDVDYPDLEGERQIIVNTTGTIVQSLHLMHGNELQKKITHEKGRAHRLSDSKMTPAKIADEVYLASLSRRPTAKERAHVGKFFKENKDGRRAATEDFIWAIINSAEFVFNH